MRDFSIDLFRAKIRNEVTALGEWLGYFPDGMDGLPFAFAEACPGCRFFATYSRD